MSIVTLLILILLGISVAYAAIVFQIVGLARIYRSWAWWVGAGAIIALATKQIWNLVRLPSAILEAQMKGVMIERLNTQQWADVIWAYAIAFGFIAFFDLLRRELIKLGMK